MLIGEAVAAAVVSQESPVLLVNRLKVTIKIVSFVSTLTHCLTERQAKNRERDS